VLKLVIKPQDEENFELRLAAYAYQRLWAEYGEHIVDSFRTLTDLDFKQKEITAVIIPGRASKSGKTGIPMTLGADYPDNDRKLGVLTHELAHRLVNGNKIWTKDDSRTINYIEHRRIYLFLYDAWCDIKDQTYADAQVIHEKEKNYTAFYEKAWDWALRLSPRQRRNTFKRIRYRRKVNINS